MALKPLTPDAAAEWKERFDVDGFVNFGRVLEPVDVAVLANRIAGICAGTIPVPEDAVRAHAGMAWKTPDGAFHPEAAWQIMDAHVHDKEAGRICRMPFLSTVSAALLGGPVALRTTQVILKPAHHGGEVPWHQDSSYWGHEAFVTCWIAIDDATPANGCMRMIPGSHRRGQLKNQRAPVAGAPLELLVTVDVDEERQLYVPVRAGCASFHHSRTLHASAKNTTPNARRAIAITFGPPT
jgi:hypothetical protein